MRPTITSPSLRDRQNHRSPQISETVSLGSPSGMRILRHRLGPARVCGATRADECGSATRVDFKRELVDRHRLATGGRSWDRSGARCDRGAESSVWLDFRRRRIGLGRAGIAGAKASAAGSRGDVWPAVTVGRALASRADPREQSTERRAPTEGRPRSPTRPAVCSGGTCATNARIPVTLEGGAAGDQRRLRRAYVPPDRTVGRSPPACPLAA